MSIAFESTLKGLIEAIYIERGELELEENNGSKTVRNSSYQEKEAEIEEVAQIIKKYTALPQDTKEMVLFILKDCTEN